MVDTYRQLEAISHRLNEESDQLNSIIRSANKKLAKLNLGIEAWIPQPILFTELQQGELEEEEPTIVRNAIELGYCQVEADWQLAVRKATLFMDEADDGKAYERQCPPDEPTPLLKASREVRAVAIRAFADVMEALKLEADRLLNVITESDTLTADLNLKYDPLTEWLKNQVTKRVKVSFEQIEDEDVIGVQLPRSAREHREWWANESSTDTRHCQCRAWLDAGYKVESVDLAREFVTFVSR